jgi:hypothetical protein
MRQEERRRGNGSMINTLILGMKMAISRFEFN